MYTVLMVAVLAVGSGDGRGGATDGHMVEQSPYALLRVGMKIKAVEELLGTQGWIGISGNKYILLYCLNADRKGNAASVWVYYDVDFGVTKWKTEIDPGRTPLP